MNNKPPLPPSKDNKDNDKKPPLPEGRPYPNEYLEHGYTSDLNPRNFTILDGEIRKLDKIQIPLRWDDRIDWQTFQVPKPLPAAGTQGPEWWIHATLAEKRAAWEAANGGSGIGVLQSAENADLTKIHRRIHEILNILPIQFTTIMAEIRYKRDRVRHRRRKLRQKMIEADAENKMKQNKDKKSSKIFHCFRHCSLHTPLAASVIHYSACFHVAVMTIAALVQQWFEIKEFNEIFPSKIAENPITTRLYSVTALCVILIGSIIGIVGLFWKNSCLLKMYILSLIGGVTLCIFQSCIEAFYIGIFEHQDSDWLKEHLRFEVKAFLSKKAVKFLLQTQEKFRCCGFDGPLDYFTPAAASGKVNLPPSCCQQTVTQTLDCYFEKGQPFPDFVHEQGCTSPLKTFLGHHFLIEWLMIPFLLFGAVMHIVSSINLNSHVPYLWSYKCCKGKTGQNSRKEIEPERKSKLEEIITSNQLKYSGHLTFKRTLGEFLLDDIEAATTSMIPPKKSPFEFENESVRGTIAYIRRRLGDCEDTTALLLCMVELLHDVEVFQESELGLKRPDSEVIARVILGLRPKKFVAPSLIDHDFERLLYEAKKDSKVREDLGRKDLIIRMNMQEVIESQAEHIAKKEEHLLNHHQMRFPLPRPIYGFRVSQWKQYGVGRDSKILRADKYLVDIDESPDPLEPDYLDQDRVLMLAAPDESEISKRTQFCIKHFPSFYELSVKDYLFLEEALFAPAIEVFSKIIAETQAILLDLHRRTRFKKSSTNDNDSVPSTNTLLQPPNSDHSEFNPSHGPRRDSFQAKQLDMDKVNTVLKQICESDAVQEDLIGRWIREHERAAAANKEISDKSVDIILPPQK